MRKRHLTVRSETIRALTADQMEAAIGAVARSGLGPLTTLDKLSCNPCPGEYTWFCSP